MKVCYRVVATCRNPAACTNLQKLHSDHKDSLDLVQLDVSDEASIQV